MANLTQWEYTRVPASVEALNKLGQEGWEAVGSEGTSSVFIMKRPKQQPQQGYIPPNGMYRG